MAIEIEAANRWIFQTLSRDTTISSLIGDKIDKSISPTSSLSPGEIPTGKFPRIHYAYSAGSDNQGLGTVRLLSRLSYIIKVVQYRQNDADEVARLVDRIDELIGKATVATVEDAIGNFWVISARRLGPIYYPEYFGTSQDFFTHNGGLYRLEITPLI
jgi:hypothetical protein